MKTHKEIMKILYIYMYKNILMTTISWFVLYIKLFFKMLFHFYFACMLCLYFISILHLHTHIKGRENSRLFVQHDIALKIPFCFYKNHFYNDIHWSIHSPAQNITGSASLHSVITSATYEKIDSSHLLWDYKFMSFDWTTLSSAHDFCKQICGEKVW